MQIDRAGREWAHWDIQTDTTGTLEVSLDRGTTWHPLERDGDTVRALVAGPDAPSDVDEAIPLPLGRSYATIRATAAPEILIRQAGLIDVTTCQ